MNIFSVKYKAHRLVNFIFYMIIFFSGFLVGFGFKNLDLNNFLSKVLFIDNVHAATHTGYGSKNYSNFSYVPSSSNWYDSQFIYNLFVDVNQVYNTNYDISDFPYILVRNNRSNQYTYYFSKYSFDVQGTKIIIDSPSSTEYLYVEVDLSSSSPSNRTFYLGYYTDVTYSVVYNGSSWPLNSSNVAGTTTNTYSFTLSKVVNISSFLAKPLMSIEYLDSSYNVISSSDCMDPTMDYCSLNINSSSGSYIKINFFLEELIDRRLDFLANSTYQIKNTIIGSNLDTRTSYINVWYYFNGSIQNIDSDLLIATDKNISYFNDTFNYSNNFSILDDYNSYSAYQISIFYNTNSSYYSTISIPYEFSLNDVTSGDTPIVQPTTPNDTIDKDDIIIDQNSQLINNQNTTNETLDDINNSINDDNIDGASSQASSFFSSFNTDSHGLTGIITAPLNLISSITSTTCSPLVLPVPFVNTNLTLPCLSSIYSQYFGSFLTIYQSITFGIVAYWVCVRIFNLVKDFKNPDHDEIEVLDL